MPTILSMPIRADFDDAVVELTYPQPSAEKAMDLWHGLCLTNTVSQVTINKESTCTSSVIRFLSPTQPSVIHGRRGLAILIDVQKSRPGVQLDLTPSKNLNLTQNTLISSHEL